MLQSFTTTTHPSFDVTDKVIVITGGLGLLGCSYSEALLACGAKVALFDVAAVPEQSSDRLVVAVDVSDPASVREGLRATLSHFGQVDGLVNNAALDSPPGSNTAENGPFEEYPLALWNQILSVNITGVFLCCQIIGGYMAAAAGGAIVNIGSTYGLVSPDQRLYAYRATKESAFFKPAAYSVSKAALSGLTKYLGTYWATKGVRVNMLVPGGVFNGQDARFLEGYVARTPMGRMARQDEYVGSILFLLSEASSYMTGGQLIVDGGFTAW